MAVRFARLGVKVAPRWHAPHLTTREPVNRTAHRSAPIAAVAPIAPDALPALRRELGRWDLTAIGVNQVIGSAIFLLPADIARQIGRLGAGGVPRWSGWRRCSSRCALPKSAAVSIAPAGPILPARVAYGRFIGFEVGWMMWFTRVASQASVSQRAGARAGLLLAVARDRSTRFVGRHAAGIGACAAHHDADRDLDVDQHPRHQAIVVGGQRADDWQAGAAACCSSSSASGSSIRRADDAATCHRAAGRHRGAAPDLCLRRLRSDRDSRRRGGESATRRAVCVRDDDLDRRRRHDADVGRGDRLAARRGRHADAARRRRGARHGRHRRADRDASARRSR